jgi:uncharacterized Fe-S cluster-containing radical SAM superfamily protein
LTIKTRSVEKEKMMGYDLLSILANFKILFQEHVYEPLELTRVMSDALYREKVLVEAEQSGCEELASLAVQVKLGLGHYGNRKSQLNKTNSSESA